MAIVEAGDREKVCVVSTYTQVEKLFRSMIRIRIELLGMCRKNRIRAGNHDTVGL